jgi:hypothetical protein
LPSDLTRFLCIYQALGEQPLSLGGDLLEYKKAIALIVKTKMCHGNLCSWFCELQTLFDTSTLAQNRTLKQSKI